MEIPLSEVIDRISILKLKIENSSDAGFKAEFEKELASCNNAVEEYAKKGLKIMPDWLERLYEINKYQWALESSMSELKKDGRDLKQIGKVYIQLQVSNKRRVAVKNEIAEVSGSGFKDIKIN